MTGKHVRIAAGDVLLVQEKHPEVLQKLTHFRFPGQGQRSTPVTCATGLIELAMLLPGRQAARVRRQAAELLCRYLGGDISLVEEVCVMRGFQDHLAVQSPDDPKHDLVCASM